MSSRTVPDARRPPRAGRVAVVGRPNVGKSTLLNRLVGSKISITSRKPQTTRQRITGIVTRDHVQIEIVDTPGYQTEHGGTLNAAMNRSVAGGLHDVDVVVWVVEALHFDRRDEAVARLLSPDVPVIVAISKCDKVKQRDQLLPFIGEISRRRDFAAIVPISAEKGEQIDRLVDAIEGLLPEGQHQHGADEITTESERFLAAEIIREKLFRQLGDELPYSAMVEIETFKEERGLRHIGASILVDKAGQKGIVIGAGGSKLKAIASQARYDMEKLFGGKVFLEVWVRVKRGWSENASLLRRMGLDAER